MIEHGPVTARLLSQGNDRHGPCVEASITISWQETGAKEIYMRNKFNIELKVDVLTSDAKRLETFVELIASTSRMLYGSAAMIASRAPTLVVTHDGLNGRTNIDIFEGEEFNSQE
jgi:hypothetical protein